MEDPLARYRAIRDFDATPEPAGDRIEAAAGDRFVIQQHDATRLHWDLRLEHDGVLPSWALPRGVPWSPEENRLAVRTEDHPLEYLDFHGEIPAGQYGAGTMTIWDRGRYTARTFDEDRVVIRLEGQRIEGTYALFPTRGRDWMIHRMDPPQDPGRRPLPRDWRPMRPGGDGQPGGEDWSWEIRWVGERALLVNDAGRITVTTADGGDATAAFPELRRLGRRLAAVETVLDAVVVAVDPSGRPVADRELLRRRRDAGSDSRARRLAEDHPVAALLVDVLWLEGHPLLERTLDQRRALLEELSLDGPSWQTPRRHLGDADALLAAARAQGLGLVAKHRTSPYRPGTSCREWVVVS